MLQQELELKKKKTFNLRDLFWKPIDLTYRALNHIEFKYNFKYNDYWKKRAKRLDDMYYSLVNAGTNALTQEQHVAIDELYSKYCEINHASHAFYTEKTGVFDARYIPDSLHRCIIDRFYNDWSAAKYIDNKCYYPLLFQDVKIPKTIAYRLNGLWYHEWGWVIDYQQVTKLVMSEDACFIKKATDSWGGLGVFYFQPTGHSVEDLTAIIKQIPCDLVIQQRIKQSDVLAKINSDSVNTLRLISLLKKDGSVKIYSSILRMGIKGSKVDNASSGGISVGINEDGSLKDVAFSNDGVRYTEHPTSHVKFGDFVIPNFGLARDMVIKLHPRFPHFRLISWDIAVDINDEPLLIEANLCDGELDFHQLNNGPVFGDDTEQILSEVFHK